MYFYNPEIPMDYRLGIIYNQQKSDFRKRVAFLLL